MSFNDILAQWEEQKRKERQQSQKEAVRKELSQKTSQEKKTEFSMDSLLEQYPPDRQMGERKEIPDRIITHTKKKMLHRMEPQETLDLHGWNGLEALKELESFLKKSKRRGLKKVLIIHGKGIHSPGGESVLRPLVKQYLEKSSLVRDFGRASGQSGGSGATWILLR